MYSDDETGTLTRAVLHDLTRKGFLRTRLSPVGGLETELEAPPPIHQVFHTGRTGAGRQSTMRVGKRVVTGRISSPQLRGALFPVSPTDPRAGVWFRGSWPQLRNWLSTQGLRLARDTSRGPVRHGSGQPHVHVIHPRLGRSQHIFVGRSPPKGDFFD